MTVVIQSNNNAMATTLLPFAGSGTTVLNRIRFFIGDLINGVWRSNTLVLQGGTYATGTATLSSVIATNTLVIGGVTITGVASGATSVQFNIGGTDTITAANIVATINALTTLNKVVQASSSAAVVTIMSLIPGTIGNLITTTAGGGTITVAAALTGGTDGTKGDISHGL